jgi:aminoglycoside phosphotransferase (APT) family kinase protein
VKKPELAGAAKVRPGEDLDWPKVAAYLKARLPGLEGELEVLQFPNGSANLTYLLRVGDRPFVLRRPPFGRLAPGAHDMAREYRVLSGLWRAFPPAPRALLLCEDHSVVGATFFVMEFRSGVVIWDEIPGPMCLHGFVARQVRGWRSRWEAVAPGGAKPAQPS